MCGRAPAQGQYPSRVAVQRPLLLGHACIAFTSTALTLHIVWRVAMRVVACTRRVTGHAWQRRVATSSNSILLCLCLPAAATGWTLAWGGAAAQQQRLEAARLNFERLAQQPGSRILHVYARPNKSCQAGRDASGSLQPGAAKRGQREAVDPRPWHIVGRVATLGAANVDAAIHAQRQLLETEARLQHQPLRPHRTLILAWAPGASATGEVSLGSFLCPRCNVQSSASSSACHKCASPRPDYAPGGELTLARRTTAAASDESGFSPGTTDR